MDDGLRALPGNRKGFFGDFLRSRRGQAAVELALALPIVLTMLFVIIDGGVGLGRWIVITNAAREGARLGAIGRPPTDVATQTIAASDGLLAGSNVTVDYQDVGGNGYPADGGDAVVVKVTYQYQLITPLSFFLNLPCIPPQVQFGCPGGSLTLAACSNMRLERGVLGIISGGTIC